MSVPPPGAPPIVPGHRLDRYELLCPLAQGGMASVWVARQSGKHGFEKLVAVKMILPHFASDQRFQKMFLDEAHIAAGIEHPNVAHILDLGEEHGVLYLAMEWIDGDSIAKLHKTVTKQGLTIPPAIVGRMMIETCAGLHAAHELRGRDGGLLGVVHRDVSPQNVLVSTKGIAKVIDFGIAKARDRLGDDTNAGVLKGKIRYMAPEQATGRPVDRRADVWAVGAMMYHLLANKLPFDGPNDIAALHRLTTGKPPLPLPPSVPKPLADVVRATLVHDIDKRTATCGELERQLESAMAAAGLRATNGDVAAYVMEHLADRAKARKQAVDVALDAAAARAQVQQVLSLRESESASGQYSLAVTNLGMMGSAPGLTSTSGVEATPVLVSQPAVAPKKRGLLFGAIGAGAAVVVVTILAVALRKPATPPTNDAPAAKVATAAAPAPSPVASTAATEAAPVPAASTAAVAVASAPSTAPTTQPVVATATAAAPKPAAKATKTTKTNKSAGDPDDGF